MAFNYSLFNREPINRHLSVLRARLLSWKGPLQIVCGRINRWGIDYWPVGRPNCKVQHSSRIEEHLL